VVRPRVCVIGAGVGTLVATGLARHGVEVVLVDEHAGILRGASANGLARLHLGYHYAGDDEFAHQAENTAQRCVAGTLAWLRRYPEVAPRPGRWWQLITDDSMTSPEAYLAFCRRLGEHQASLAAADPAALAVLGPAQDAARVLDPADYAPHVRPGRVLLGVETRERIVDLGSLRATLERELRELPGVTLRFGRRVRAVEPRPKVGGSIVELTDGERVGADAVVNCTWHDLDRLQPLGGAGTPPMSTRLRVVACAESPPALRRVPSMFFHRGVLGNHTLFDDGPMRFVSEPVCNLATSPGAGVPESWRALLLAPEDPVRWLEALAAALTPATADAAAVSQRPPALDALAAQVVTLARRAPAAAGAAIHDAVAEAVVAGYASLVPAVRAVRHVRLLPTVTTDLGEADLYDPTGSAHRRDWWTRCDEHGTITVYPGKFTFGVLAAEDAVERALRHLGRPTTPAGRVPEAVPVG
jgi:hypothetical protein